jgi:integrase
MQPGWGPLYVKQFKQEFDDLGIAESVGVRYLTALRLFSRWGVEHPVLPSGVDLPEIYGALASPLGDRDLRKVRRDQKYALPTSAELPAIYECATCWAESQPRWRHVAHRTVAIVITAFESAIRGVNLRTMLLHGQKFDQTAALPVLSFLRLETTKNGEEHLAYPSPYGLAYLNWWLAEKRPLYAPAMEGVLFPAVPTSRSSVFEPMSAAALYESTGRLFDALKQKGLLDPKFTFHGTRKTFATNYLANGGTVPDLMKRGGWSSYGGLAAYIQNSRDAIDRNDDGFARTLGMR